MVFPSHSQNILTEGPKNRIESFVNQRGDTMVTMHYEDARILLEDVLLYEYTDSLLAVYKERDSLSSKTITLQKDVITKLSKEKMNLEEMNKNLESLIANKEEEITLKDDIIKQQKKEIRKQKVLKIIGFAGAIVLPIVVLLVK